MYFIPAVGLGEHDTPSSQHFPHGGRVRTTGSALPPFPLLLKEGAPAAFPRSEHCALKVLNSPCWPQAKPAISNPTLPLIKLIF